MDKPENIPESMGTAIFAEYMLWFVDRYLECLNKIKEERVPARVVLERTREQILIAREGFSPTNSFTTPDGQAYSVRLLVVPKVSSPKE